MADQNMGNFLATDKVPDTIFGIPVVSKREDYTEADLAFFKEHPEAGGYYDMGEGTPEDGTTEGAPVQADGPRGKYPGAWNNPGNLRPGADMYAGQNGTKTAKDGSRFLMFDTPQDGLNAMANVIRQIASGKVKGALTPTSLIKVYAPKEDGNDADGYAKFVADRLGIGVSDALNLKDRAQMAKLLDVMVRRDSGHPHANWFTKGEYDFAAGLIDRAMPTKGAK